MKKQENCSLIATGEFTASCSSIRTLVNLASLSSDKHVEDVVALWDTGSEHSGISQEIAVRLGLRVLEWQNVRYGDNSEKMEPVYVVRVMFPQSGRSARVYVNGFTDEAQDFIIGIDLIRLGRFLLEPTSDGGVHFSFELPE